MVSDAEKILFVDSVSDLYGSSRIARTLIFFLREMGKSVDAVVAVERNDTPHQYAREMPIPILVMNDFKRSPVRHLLKVLQIGRIFQKELLLDYASHNIIYCNTFATLPAVVAARLRGKRVILHLHETAPSVVITMLFLLIRWALRFEIIVVSNAVSKSWWLDGAPRVHIVHNGIPDLDCLPYGPREIDLIFVGRLTEKKGFSTFIEALRLLDNGEERRVCIVGGTIPGQVFPEHSISGFRRLKIEYLGEISDASVLFSDARVACIPSTFADPFPTTVLEALRAGCDIVATDVGGIPEALEHTTSRLVKPSDANALARALDAALSDKSNINGVHRNRERFVKTFDLAAFRFRFLSAVQESFRNRIN